MKKQTAKAMTVDILVTPMIKFYLIEERNHTNSEYSYLTLEWAAVLGVFFLEMSHIFCITSGH